MRLRSITRIFRFPYTANESHHFFPPHLIKLFSVLHSERHIFSIQNVDGKFSDYGKTFVYVVTMKSIDDWDKIYRVTLKKLD